MYLPFTLYKRKTTKKKRFIYYCQFRDASGRRMTAVSTGKNTKVEATAWATEQLSRGLVSRTGRCTFGEYAERWFLWDQCEYLARKREWGSYSRSYAENQRGLLTRHILPYFESLPLDSISPTDIETWLVRQKQSNSAAVANRSATVLKIMLKEAVRRGLLNSSPAKTIEKLPERPAEKGVLGANEIVALFTDQAFHSVWHDAQLHRTLNALAFTTGARMGELQALRWHNLKDEYIEIANSWDRKYGLKEPKASSARIVPLTPTVAQWLDQLRSAEKNAEAHSFIFHGNDLNQPVDHKVILKYFYRALKAVGVNEALRKERNLTFHSWRHTFHVVMRGTMSDTDLRRLTGHRTEQMTEHYDHNTVELIRRVNPLIETALTPASPQQG